ncbi:hypothetical protein E2C01_018246 [Portunus trituberculatus]|uniref:Uncharacterized protein n=1 Tax=Portunus trituberculatus TaxID=210409 RepID=A0A5B7DWA7_PORTR|nr:hypothetical protein [Portunus trituberculatus]
MSPALYEERRPKDLSISSESSGEDLPRVIPNAATKGVEWRSAVFSSCTSSAISFIFTHLPGKYSSSIQRGEERYDRVPGCSAGLQCQGVREGEGLGTKCRGKARLEAFWLRDVVWVPASHNLSWRVAGPRVLPMSSADECLLVDALSIFPSCFMVISWWFSCVGLASHSLGSSHGSSRRVVVGLGTSGLMAFLSV